MLEKWYSQGTLTNPAAGTILADTGPLQTSGVYRVTCVATSSVAATVSVEHRDSGNANTLEAIGISVPVGGTVSFDVPVRISSGERIRAVLSSAITGTITVTLCISRVHSWIL